MSNVLDTSSDEEHLSKPLQTNNKQPINLVTFPIVYSGIISVTNRKK